MFEFSRESTVMGKADMGADMASFEDFKRKDCYFVTTSIKRTTKAFFCSLDLSADLQWGF